MARGGQQHPYAPQVPPEVWAEDEPHVLLLLEPEEFVRGVVQRTQVRRSRWQGWVLCLGRQG